MGGPEKERFVLRGGTLRFVFSERFVLRIIIKQLIARAFTKKENRESWRLNSFYENVIESSLSGIGNLRLIKELPELIIETAWKKWKYIPPLK